uniref:Uncharacterized protein n=1 Tax=Meloidogyne floridensis TaxID=298350 RepID=A0A915NNN5_9BILA
MGCLFKCLDPGPPDDSVRHFWHIRGLLLDALPCSSNNENTNSQQQQQQQKQSKPDNLCRLPPGVLYVYEGRLVYRSRRWMPWPSNIFLLSSSSGRRQPGEFSIELCQIGDVNVVEQFVSQRDGKPFRCQGPLVDVVVTGKQPNIHLGLLTAQPDCV